MDLWLKSYSNFIFLVVSLLDLHSPSSNLTLLFTRPTRVPNLVKIRYKLRSLERKHTHIHTYIHIYIHTYTHTLYIQKIFPAARSVEKYNSWTNDSSWFLLFASNTISSRKVYRLLRLLGNTTKKNNYKLNLNNFSTTSSVLVLFIFYLFQLI